MPLTDRQTKLQSWQLQLQTRPKLPAAAASTAVHQHFLTVKISEKEVQQFLCHRARSAQSGNSEENVSVSQSVYQWPHNWITPSSSPSSSSLFQRQTTRLASVSGAAAAMLFYSAEYIAERWLNYLLNLFLISLASSSSSSANQWVCKQLPFFSSSQSIN